MSKKNSGSAGAVVVVFLLCNTARNCAATLNLSLPSWVKSAPCPPSWEQPVSNELFCHHSCFYPEEKLDVKFYFLNTFL